MRKWMLTLGIITLFSIATALVGRPEAADAMVLADSAPVGSIVAWPGQANRIPSGWRECNGALVDAQTYPALAQAIGTTWGGVGTSQIKLPDLRGYFLRGVSGATNVDPNKNQRIVPAGGGSNGPGSTQLSAIRDHRHGMASQHYLEGFRGKGFNGAGFQGNSDNKPVGPFYTTYLGDGLGGIQETRPINAYVYWIIRVQ